VCLLLHPSIAKAVRAGGFVCRFVEYAGGCTVHKGRLPSTGRLCATFLVVVSHYYFPWCCSVSPQRSVLPHCLLQHIKDIVHVHPLGCGVESTPFVLNGGICQTAALDCWHSCPHLASLRCCGVHSWQCASMQHAAKRHATNYLCWQLCCAFCHFLTGGCRLGVLGMCLLGGAFAPVATGLLLMQLQCQPCWLQKNCWRLCMTESRA
jgi:hypothetical protein